MKVWGSVLCCFACSWGRSLPHCRTPHRRSSAGPAGGAGQVTTRATAAQHCAALPGPERARPALCSGHRGHRGQSERQGQDRRPATWGGSRGPAGSRRRAGTDPKQPSWRGGGCWPDRSPTCHGAIFIIHPYSSNPGFPGGSVVKDRPAIQETRVPSLGRENPLEKAMATHSSTLAWRIPWREEPGRLQSMGLQRVGHV